MADSATLDSAASPEARTLFEIPENRWDDARAKDLSPAELLLYRSNLLGADLTVTNFGGGNTSAKLAEVDPLSGEAVEVLWVKGSGGDLGSMALDGFSTLYMDRLLSLERLYKGEEAEDEMVDHLPHCTFGLNGRAASIDTPLHGFLPFAHVDHVHPDAVIALAAAKDGRAAAEHIWGDRVGWLGWKRPGFELGLRLRDLVARQPDLKAVILEGHGLICWGADSKACYETTLGLIGDAARHLNRISEDRAAFGGAARRPLPPTERRRIAATLMPRLRARLDGLPKTGHFIDDQATLEFVCSRDFERLSAIGTSCPDHFLRTKIAPLTLDPDRIEEPDYLDQALGEYRAAYAAYYARNAGPGDPPIRDSNPVVVLTPGVGQITFAGDRKTARLAGEFYTNAVNVMRGAEWLGGYQGLPEDEAFAIEYWALEEAKLRRMPAPKPLAGRIALVTGAAGGIGAAAARRLASEGACVMLSDRDADALSVARDSLSKTHGDDLIRACVCDVTDEDQIEAVFAECSREFGGLDILVVNAGIASSAPLTETSVDLWNANHEVLAKGYFLTARAAFPLMQAKGGSIVFVGSKNAVAASANASAYASAKAAALHLARCLAVEGAPNGIRVNTVNPDAVIKGSRIWDGDWRRARAETYGVNSGEELEAFYRNRSLLRRDVLPEDIAEAVYFFASDVSAKSTGNIINVDAGNAQSFTR